MASKQHIKETINALCKVILHNGGTKITPETFRLAKFDKNEATGAMWKLLFETIWYINFNTFRPDEDFNGERNREMVLWTKHEVFSRGYYVREFYLLPDDTSFGSREILLAFGWVMSKSKLLYVFLENCNNILEECLPINWESLIGPNPSEKSCGVSKNFSNEAKTEKSWEELSWILGNLRLTLKGLYAAENQLASLVGKVHSATQGAESAKGHLSALEVSLLMRPKRLARFLEKVEQYNAYLENLVKFVDMQDVFWKWLESVCEAKISECTKEQRPEWKSKESCRMCRDTFDKELSSIVATQAEIQKVITGNEMSKASKRDCPDLIVQIKVQELNEKLENLTLSESLHSKQETFPELQHVLPNSNVKQLEKSCAQQEIDTLRGRISELELELLELRNEHFDILNNFVGSLEDAVFIPPIGKTKEYTELRNK